MTADRNPREESQYSEEACFVVDSLQQIGSRRRPIVLYDLQDDEMRFDERKRSTGASSAPSRACSTSRSSTPTERTARLASEKV